MLRPARSRWTVSPTRTDAYASGLRRGACDGRPRPIGLSVGGERATVGAALSRQPPAHGSAGSPTAAKDRRGRPPGVVRDRRASVPVVGRPDPIERVGAGFARRAPRAGGRASAGSAGSSRRPRTTVSSSARRQPVEGRRAVRTPGHDLGEHRVEAAADLGRRARSRHRPGCPRRPASGAPRSAPSPAGSRPRRPRHRVGPRPRGRSVGRSSGVEPERLARRDPELVRDQVATGHELGHRVLDLEPRVHLEEGRDAAVVDQELARAGAHVADGAGEAQGGLPQPMAEVGIDGRRRRLLEHLLVAALDRAVTFAQVDPVAVPRRTGPGSRRGDAPSTRRSRISRSSPKAAIASRRAAASDIGQLAGLADGAHALAAAAGGRLDEEREADLAAARVRTRSPCPGPS